MRTIYSLNENWGFIREEGTLEQIMTIPAEAVDLPHTWSNPDEQSNRKNCIPGAFWYVKYLDFDAKPGKKYFLEFEIVSLVTNVYVNGVHVIRHQGESCKFQADITSLLVNGDNLIAVEADNRNNGIPYPQTADFTFSGDIYRNATLIEMDAD